ncbi:TM2 domain-containing protein [Campylobacter pinnipediorum]|uniref:TM2 domain-containing protein n=1 Tax=Campylobacter pinnipediorum TaxID=1965231 RepID=UPI00084DA285|nr:TM2 domain-containing protein [Campylobacter pinnipediorum]
MNDLFFVFKNKIPQESYFDIRNKFDLISKETSQKLSILKLKDPFLAVFLSIFFGMLGADRFYKGDVSHGILKLITGFYIGFDLIYFVNIDVYELSEYAFFIYYIIDVFLVYHGVKKDNLQKIQIALL